MGESPPVFGLHRPFGDIEVNDVYLGTYNPEDPNSFLFK